MDTPIRAIHIRSGHVGEVQQVEQRIGLDGLVEARYYFEDHVRPTVAGWYPADALRIEPEKTILELAEGVREGIRSGSTDETMLDLLVDRIEEVM